MNIVVEEKQILDRKKIKYYPSLFELLVVTFPSVQDVLSFLLFGREENKKKETVSVFFHSFYGEKTKEKKDRTMKTKQEKEEIKREKGRERKTEADMKKETADKEGRRKAKNENEKRDKRKEKGRERKRNGDLNSTKKRQRWTR